MKNRSVKKEYFILAAILGCAILSRVFAIWIGRPEFVGWFSHTYYYFIEVQSLLEHGSLAYPDMPFLFYVYAAVAKLLMLFGIDSKPSIILSTRLVMSAAPALVAFAVYLLFRSINEKRPFSGLHWILILTAAFLPLSVVHLPEILQKNMFGLVLFAFLQLAVYRLIRDFDLKKLAAVLVLTALILLTHLGTFAVVVLFYIAILIAYFLNSGLSRKSALSLLLVLPLTVVSVSVIYFVDITRFNRIFYYVGRSLSDSPIGLIFTSETVLEKLQFSAAVLLPGAIVFLLLRIYSKRLKELPEHDQVFGLANFTLIYLLVLPVFDVDLLVRFILFVSIPALILLVYILAYSDRAWLKNSLVVLFLLGCITMAFGEFMGVVVRNDHNRKTESEIASVRDRKLFKPGDFIITKYGVNTFCNWFFSTKSGLITSFNRQDFSKYERVFILNPVEGEAPKETIDDLKRKSASTESAKYEMMRSNILVPQSAKLVLRTDNMEIYELTMPPETWKYDSKGDWIGY